MSRPIRIALIITELRVGGAERCLVHLATGLDPAQFAPVVYCLAPRPAGPRARLVENLDAAGVPVRFLDASSRWQFRAAVRELANELGQQSPHVVHTFLFHANVVGALAGRRAGAQALVAGLRVADPSRPRRLVERWLARRVDRLVCVSQAVADLARDRGQIPAEKLLVIANGIDPSQYGAAKPADLTTLGVPPGRRVILCAGRLTRQKGLDWLLRLAPRILAELPDCDLVLAGEGPQRAQLARISRRQATVNRVHFAGWRADLANLLAGSSLLALPSRWEGMPNVLLEAMASGLPVLATRVAGVEQLLGSLASDQSVPLGSEKAFVERILFILHNPLHAKHLGDENRRRAIRCFPLSGMIEQYGALYESLARAL